MWCVLLILLNWFVGDGYQTTARKNECKQKAAEAMAQHKYAEAVEQYKYLIDTLKINDPKVYLNTAHAYYHLKMNDVAAGYYEKALSSNDPSLRSIAFQQLGVMAYQNTENKTEALNFFKWALQANPFNQQARYNYELLSRQNPAPNQQQKNKDKNQQKQKENKDKSDNQKQENDKNQNSGDKNNQDKNGDQNKNGQNKNGQNKEEQNKDGKKDQNQNGKNGKDQNNPQKNDQKGDQNKPGQSSPNQPNKPGEQNQDVKGKGNDQGKGQKGEKAGDQKDKDNQGEENLQEASGGKKGKEKVMMNREALQRMGMSEQKAKTLLEAMRNSELQYYQQIQKAGKKEGARKKGKNDW